MLSPELRKQGKGSIQFLLNQPIPKALVVKMAKYRKELILKDNYGAIN